MLRAHGSRVLASAFVVASALATAPGCSRNPATGKLQILLIDEGQEVALGQRGDEEIVKAVGEYGENAEATALVRLVGKAIADGSERPALPWTFRVLDDPGVNAFAVPGGWVYVTRGLLAHLSSEDELAAVLAHEIGHVAARHGAVQLRKTAVARRSVGVFRVVDPNLRHIGGIAARSADLALLRYSRDDEHEADDLSLRYVTRGGYDPGAIAEVFRLLASITAGAENQRVPTWMSTHPEPQARLSRVQAKLAALGIDGGRAGDRLEPDPKYLALITGMVVGDDPRRGYFLGRTFVHPRAGLRIDLPPEWEAAHDDVSVLAMSPDKKTLLVLAPTEAETAKKGIDDFFADGGIQRGDGWTGQVGGYVAESSAFAIAASDGRLAGLLAFIEFEGRVLVLVAIGSETEWAGRADAIAQAFASFRKLTEAGLRDVPPMRVVLTTLREDTTLRALNERSPSVVPIEMLARMNHVEPGDSLAAGRIVKRVEGFNPALARTATTPRP